MKPPPEELNDAKICLYSVIDHRHKPTGGCKHTVGGEVMGTASALAICQYADQNDYYLFYCDEDWQVLNDTWCQTIDDALNQAEFEYTGVKETFQTVPS